jgi:hypothetical protein
MHGPGPSETRFFEGEQPGERPGGSGPYRPRHLRQSRERGDQGQALGIGERTLFRTMRGG